MNPDGFLSKTQVNTISDQEQFSKFPDMRENNNNGDFRTN